MGKHPGTIDHPPAAGAGAGARSPVPMSASEREQGKRAEYSFVTTWLLRAPRDQVWEVLRAQERWPQWWRGVERSEQLRKGDDGGVGTVIRLAWRSLLPYRVEFEVTTTRVQSGRLLEGRAVGDLSGVGRWRLFDHDGVTAVTYEWNVATTKAWMNLVAPLARPVFEWNHDWVMARGGEGIAQRLGCELLGGG